MLVTLEEAKRALRVEEDDFDGEITDRIQQSEDAVLDYLKLEELPDHWRVKAAVILGVQSLFDDEKAELISGLGTGDPRNAMVALLYRLRDPALA